MQSFNSLLNNKSTLPFPNANDNNQVPWLVSHYMQMFDLSKVDTTALLGKRERQTLEDYHQTELLKKLKPTLNTGEWKPPVVDMTIKPTMLSAYSPYSLPNFVTTSKRGPELTGAKESTLVMKDAKVQYKEGDKVVVKQEYVKQEEIPVSQKTPSSKISKTDFDPLPSETSDMSETSPETPLQMVKNKTSVSLEGAPALAEFTRDFPDWDLATIFSFIRSGKPKTTFEKEKNFRNERKMRTQSKKEEKTLNLKSKQMKTKKRLDTSDEYKPSRALKKVMTPKEKELNQENVKLRPVECKEEHL